MEVKQKWMRSMASLVCIGSGQWMKGDVRRGWRLFLFAYCTLPWIFIFALSVSNFLTFFFLVTLPAIYLGLTLYSALDAWQ